MRLIISFNGGGLVITFSGMCEILNKPDYIVLTGPTVIDVNAFTICSTTSPLVIMKSYLLAATEVYFDTRIEEVTDGKNSTSDL